MNQVTCNYLQMRRLQLSRGQDKFQVFPLETANMKVVSLVCLLQPILNLPILVMFHAYACTTNSILMLNSFSLAIQYLIYTISNNEI